MSEQYDLIVIGGGPAGYVGAIRAAQLGMKTLVFEKTSLGGTCLNVGCIPTKALYQSAETAATIREAGSFGIKATLGGIDFPAVMARKDAVVKQLVGGVGYLFKKHGIKTVATEARFLSAHRVTDKTGAVYDAKNILIAAGSSNLVPPIPGIDGKNCIGSTELLAMKTMPKSLVIIGGGVIGCEFANILNSFGCKVTIVEMLPSLLANMDAEGSALTQKAFEAAGISVFTGAKVKSVADAGALKSVSYEKDGKTQTAEAEYVLVATGRRPNTAALALGAAGVDTDKRGYIRVNDKMQTSAPGVYAAGDVTGRTFLAHAAYEEGIVAVANMAGEAAEMDFRAIPGAVFLDTEISSVGMTEQKAREAGYDVLTGKFMLTGNGKALAMGKNKGYVKVVSEKANHQILGVHIAGPSASELVTIGASLISMEALLEDVAHTIYPHPSVSEALREACLDALGRALHA